MRESKTKTEMSCLPSTETHGKFFAQKIGFQEQEGYLENMIKKNCKKISSITVQAA